MSNIDYIQFPVESKEFGRIATGVAKNVILQKIREEDGTSDFSLSEAGGTLF